MAIFDVFLFIDISGEFEYISIHAYIVTYDKDVSNLSYAHLMYRNIIIYKIKYIYIKVKY